MPSIRRQSAINRIYLPRSIDLENRSTGWQREDTRTDRSSEQFKTRRAGRGTPLTIVSLSRQKCLRSVEPAEIRKRVGKVYRETTRPVVVQKRETIITHREGTEKASKTRRQPTHTRRAASRAQFSNNFDT